MKITNKDILKEFNNLSIHNRIDPFFEEDIESYFENPAEFSLALKRSKSELSLYGSKHVQLRQAFFNEMPKETRRSLMISKLKAANIYDWLLKTLAIKEKCRDTQI